MSAFTRHSSIATVAFFALVAPAVAQGDISFSDRATVMVQQSAQPTRVLAAKTDRAKAVEANYGYGADPDPASFDRDGVERWWAKYSKKHPAH